MRNMHTGPKRVRHRRRWTTLCWGRGVTEGVV